jgi:hypothetical protein
VNQRRGYVTPPNEHPFPNVAVNYLVLLVCVEFMFPAHQEALTAARSCTFAVLPSVFADADLLSR